MTSKLRVPGSVLHVVIAIAMALSLFVVRASHSLSHDPFAILAAEKRAHAESAAKTADHGHVHDEGDPSERAPGHFHGHNPADHSHETAGIVAHLTYALEPISGAMSIHPFRRPEPAERWRLERPPKLPLLA